MVHIVRPLLPPYMKWRIAPIYRGAIIGGLSHWGLHRYSVDMSDPTLNTNTMRFTHSGLPIEEWEAYDTEPTDNPDDWTDEADE